MEEAGKTYTGRLHPATSYGAAASVEECAGTLRERVFRAIEATGAVGLTADEIEFTLKMPGNTARPRICELREAGRVERTLTTRMTRSGRKAYVYVATRPTVEELPCGVKREGGEMVLDLEWG